MKSFIDLNKILIALLLLSVQSFAQAEYSECVKLLELAKKITGPEELTYVVRMPKFIGSDDSLKVLLCKPPYPLEALEQKVEGEVRIAFVVDTLGRLRCPTVNKGIGYGCDEAVLNYIKSLNLKFTPAQYPYKGRYIPISVRLLLPVEFSLKKRESAK